VATARCQMQKKDSIHEGNPQPVILSRRSRFVLKLSHRLDPRFKRFIKKRMNWLTSRQDGRTNSIGTEPAANVNFATVSLKTGDSVRIRSIDEIRATLNPGGRLKGCAFMPEMEQYCGTIQRVYKPVERFLDECDYTVHKAKGLVILENLFCQGIAGAGRCDRSCFYFWRVEWLEHLA
jgi:hypothetical protein